MTEENPGAASIEDKPPTPAPKSSSPPEDRAPHSPGQESLEDYESPKRRTRSLFQVSNAGENPSKTEYLSTLSKVVDSWQEESPSSICLCQPDPKVPRPRNAFILYRQHNQAAVVAQNPGLANPKISKIIGDHWRNSSKEIKAHWKLLADEEKIRHQKQYPDYRYQPRRSGRNSSLSNFVPPGGSIEGELRKCPKCGGRSITTTSMMSGPQFSNQNTPASPYTSGLSLSTPSASAGRFLRRVGSPPLGAAPTGYRTRPSNAGGLPPALGSPRFKRTEPSQSSPTFKRPGPSQRSPNSPDPKRRRINNAPYAPVRAANGPGTPYPFTHGQRRESLPRADFLGPSMKSPFRMGPPPRPHNTQPHPDGSLTLAPLQAAHHGPMSMDTQAKSLEAMILSIPTLGKIRVLSKISRPLAPPGPTSPARRTRGIVIAIDAADPDALNQLTQTLATSLNAYAVRVFTTPYPPAEAPPSFQAYLRLVDQYHTLSARVVEYITTPPHRDPPPSPPPISPKSLPVEGEAVVSKEASIPVAIVPGWQVTWSDWFACHVGIRDAYSPMDHWQWGATLWRDVIGADVTVAVQPVTVQEESPTKSREGDSKGDTSTKEARVHVKSEKGGIGSGGGSGVDVRLDDARAVVVKAEKEGVVGEGASRRVGFEIGEWVRGWDERRLGRRGS